MPKRSRPRRRTPAVGEVWVVPPAVRRQRADRAHAYRRVIAVVWGRVIYCWGGRHVRHCAVETFIRWASTARAIKARGAKVVKLQ